MVKNVNQVESKAVEASLPKESFFIEDLDKYVAVHINNTKKSATLEQIHDFQKKLLYSNAIERVLNIHPPNDTNTVLFVKFKN